jgi:hypothetical protein
MILPCVCGIWIEYILQKVYYDAKNDSLYLANTYSNYGMYGRWKNFFNLDVHEKEIVKLALWAFGFGGEYVYTIVLYNS